MAAEVGKSHVTEHQEEEEGERQRAVRLRRNEETRAELESLRKMEKVSDPFARRSAYTYLAISKSCTESSTCC